MLYLVQHLIPWLLLTAFAAGIAGWAWHKWKSQGKQAELDRERARLRRELMSLVSSGDEQVASEHERQSEMLRSIGGVRETQIADLERQLAEARAAKDDLAARLAEAQRELEHTRAHEVIVEPRPVPAPADAPETEAARWRMRYLEARIRHLETAPPPEANDAPLRADLAVAQARIAELEGERSAMPAQADDNEELNRLKWQARYFGSRVRYLESDENVAPAISLLAAEPEAPQRDEEEEQRRAWRMLYLDKRIGYLADASETRIAELTEARDALRARVDALEADLLARDTRIGALSTLEPQLIAQTEKTLALEARLSDAAAEAASKRPLVWRARYFEKRTAFLEAEIAARAAAAPASAPASMATPIREEAHVEEAAAEMEAAPKAAPALRATGASTRPPALQAPRFGAPEDLTLIDGVGPMQQSTLNSLGVFHFDQIAAWTPENIAWVDQYLRLRGRITRERWVEQADAFAKGAVRARALEDA